MKLRGAFLAEGFTRRDGHYDIRGAGFGSIRAPSGTAAVRVHLFVLCDTGDDEVGLTIAIRIIAIGPNGETLTSSRIEKVISDIGGGLIASERLITPVIGPGHYAFRAWIEGRDHGAVTAPLEVYTGDG